MIIPDWETRVKFLILAHEMLPELFADMVKYLQCMVCLVKYGEGISYSDRNMLLLDEIRYLIEEGVFLDL